MPKAIDKKITSSFTSFIYKYIHCYIFILTYVNATLRTFFEVCLLRFSIY